MTDSLVVCLTALTLALQFSCGSTSKEEDEPLSEDQLAAAADDLVFLTATPTSANVLRYECPNQEALLTIYDVRARCSNASLGSGLPIDAYMAQLRAAYLWRVGDSSGVLSVQEELAWRNMRRTITGAGANEEPPRGQRAAVGMITTRFYDVLALAYTDGPLTPLEGTLRPGTGAAFGDIAVGDVPPRGAAVGEEKVGSVTFQTRNVAGNTTVRVALSSASRSYDSLRVELVGTAPGRRCAIAQSLAANATGLTPALGQAFTWRLAPAGMLSLVRLRVRMRPVATPQTCTADVYAVVTPAPPAMDPQVEAKATAFMQSVMGSSDHRMWHFLWHGIRSSWDTMTPLQRSKVVTAFGAQWGRAPQDMNVGEEFLHMHRGMLLGLLKQASDAGLPLYPTGTDGENKSIYNDVWTSPGKFVAANGTSKVFPLPDGTTTPGAAIESLDAEAKSAQSLALSLGEYGSLLERGIHNTMHMAWADTRDGGAGPGGSIGTWSTKKVLEVRSPPASWISPSNRYLGSTYTSHVNPVFWRLHGYIDNRINDWLRVHNYSRIAESSDVSCTEAVKCYAWKRTWDGLLPSTHASHGGNALEAGFSELNTGTRRAIVDNSGLSPE